MLLWFNRFCSRLPSSVIQNKIVCCCVKTSFPFAAFAGHVCQCTTILVDRRPDHLLVRPQLIGRVWFCWILADEVSTKNVRLVVYDQESWSVCYCSGCQNPFITKREKTKTDTHTMPPRTQGMIKNSNINNEINNNNVHLLSIGLFFVREAPVSKEERVSGKCYKWKGTKRLWDGKRWHRPCALAGCSKRALTHAAHKGKCDSHSTAKPYACNFEGCDKRFARSHHNETHKRTHVPTKGAINLSHAKMISNRTSVRTRTKSHSYLYWIFASTEPVN